MPRHFCVKQKFDFLQIEHAIIDSNNTSSLGLKCQNEQEKVAWKDCVELYGYTVLKFNETLDPNTRCTQDDIQTWLSSALTNQQTCQDGFIELGVSNYFLILLHNFVSKLISNTMSLNKVLYDEPNYKGSYPIWMKPNDQKLLSSSSSLVAQAML